MYYDPTPVVGAFCCVCVSLHACEGGGDLLLLGLVNERVSDDEFLEGALALLNGLIVKILAVNRHDHHFEIL